MTRTLRTLSADKFGASIVLETFHNAIKNIHNKTKGELKGQNVTGPSIVLINCAPKKDCLIQKKKIQNLLNKLKKMYR